MSLLNRIFCSTWTSPWDAREEMRSKFPERHTDFRDAAPYPLDEVNTDYAPYVQEGRWTVGLFDMWCPRAKHVKHTVHIPCWDSFRVNPLKWRGSVFGRTCKECYWTGLRQTRWARMVYAANLGREYVLPVRGVGRHGYKSEIEALCWMYCLMGCVFSCGIGQIFSLCGNLGVNFGAIYSCHAREKIRRRYKLPPAFGLPPGIDDFLVHFLCSYCSSHQEIRELAIRGIDGPGMHIMDVIPQSFNGAPGAPEAAAVRKQIRDAMLAHPPRAFQSRPVEPEEGAVKAVLMDAKMGATVTLEGAKAALMGNDDDASSTSSSHELGWRRCNAPAMAPVLQEMSRGSTMQRSQSLKMIQIINEVTEVNEVSGIKNEDQAQAPHHKLQRSWSVAY